MPKRPLIVLTAGDVAGVGPEILVRAVRTEAVRDACDAFILCHPEVLQRAAELCNSQAPQSIRTLTTVPTDRRALEQTLNESAMSVDRPLVCFNPVETETALAATGEVSAACGDAAYQYLTSAINMTQNGLADAIATAPLNKAALHAAGHHFPGHTEILAHQCDVDDFAMMLHLPESRIAPLRDLVRTSTDRHPKTEHGLSIAHVTLHTSVVSVSELLTTTGIVEKVRLMHDFLTRIGCQRRAIGVCALNPHGGEDGLFGDEESQVIVPAVRHFDATDVNVTGPLPVDTLIRRAVAGEFDSVVAMYHDQGHIPVKMIGFDSAVNITLGLPIIRTSPTHGTAFDRAWNRDTPADPAGMIEAILMAAQLASRKA